MVTKSFRLLLILAVPFTLLFFSNCKKDVFSGSKLSFSTDTLTFDTVFTAMGSTSRAFKVFNTDKKPIKITDIKLMHLVGTQFRMNVDGIPGDHITDVEVPAKDSIYIYVEVTVNPNSQSTPFVIIDDVQFTVNNNVQTVHLQAFGQNAHFHYGEDITGSVTWSNDLPHVIISKGAVPGVWVHCGANLRINSGCKVFFANNSARFVSGTLHAESSAWSDSIIFRGVRLEQFYDDKPGQWFGIVFLRDNSNGCTGASPTGYFDHCVVNESSYGIYAGAGLDTNFATYLGANGRPDVTIKNTIVKNSQYNAIYGFNAHIVATNSLFFAAGEYLLKFGLGGDYTFNGCTMYNVGSRYVDHQKEVLLLSNLAAKSADQIYKQALVTNFENCVVYGNLQNEILFSNVDDTNLTDFSNTFNTCLLKTPSDTAAMFATLTGVLYNQDPRFSSESDFTPQDSSDTNFASPLIDQSASGFGLSVDLYDHTRGVARPGHNASTPFDIGAVERQP